MDLEPQPPSRRVDAIDHCSKTWMTGVSSQRAPASSLTEQLARSWHLGRHALRPSTLTRRPRSGRKHGQRMGHHGAKLTSARAAGRSDRTGATTAYDPIIGAASVRSTYGVQGSGMTVAVIDTGVDYNNPALGGGFGPGNKVIAGFDFADNTSDPMATARSMVPPIAGLIGSDDANDLGVAPGVNIVAFRVTDSSNTASLAQHRQCTAVGHQQSRPIQYHLGEHVAVRRRKLRSELVRQRRRRRRAESPS